MVTEESDIRNYNNNKERLAGFTESITIPVKSHRKLMIIEDDKIMAELYRHVLEQNGHSVVIVAEDANEALTKFAQARFFGLENEEPEIVISNNRLPDGLGIEVSKELLKMNPQLKIILATADTDVSDDLARKVGIVQVLRKPFSMSSLLSAILDISEILDNENKKEIQVLE